MIYVTLGTQDKDFSRPLIEIDKLIEKGVITEDVIVQAGSTKYKSDKMKIFTEIPNKDYMNYMKKCNLLITHGGVGSITDALRLNKKVIVIPRLNKYKEHVNDHQLDIVNAFYEKGYILKAIETDELEERLKEVKSFVPNKFKSDNKKMLNLVKDFIDNN